MMPYSSYSQRFYEPYFQDIQDIMVVAVWMCKMGPKLRSEMMSRALWWVGFFLCRDFQTIDGDEPHEAFLGELFMEIMRWACLVCPEIQKLWISSMYGKRNVYIYIYVYFIYMYIIYICIIYIWLYISICELSIVDLGGHVQSNPYRTSKTDVFSSFI